MKIYMYICISGNIFIHPWVAYSKKDVKRRPRQNRWRNRESIYRDEIKFRDLSCRVYVSALCVSYICTYIAASGGGGGNEFKSKSPNDAIERRSNELRTKHNRRMLVRQG